MSEAILHRRTAIVVIGLATISLLAGFAATIFGSRATDVQSHDADSFSSSAIGHRGLVELLQRSGRRVLRSRGQSASKAGSEALLLLLEPSEGEDRIGTMLARADHVLLALPKWAGREHRGRAGWIESAELETLASVQDYWASTGDGGAVFRPTDEIGNWRVRGLDFTPSIDRPQLVRPTLATPAIDTDQGALLVELSSRSGASHWVLSDPDLLSNHGIGHGDNAALVLQLLERIAPDDCAIVVDETLHGHAVAPSVWAEFGRFPLVLILAQSLLALGVLVWAGSIRFRRPEPDDSGLTPGKTLLVQNTAELLLLGSHSVSVLKQYFNLSERRVADACRLQPELTVDQRRERLRRIGTARHVERDIREVAELVAAAGDSAPGVEQRVLRAARVVRKWTVEMLAR